MKKIILLLFLLSQFSFSQWTNNNFKDILNNSTGKKYIISDIIQGHFSNSGTPNSKLFSYILITENNVGIFLSEYSKNNKPVNFLGSIAGKNEKNEIFESTVEEWNNNGGVYVSNSLNFIDFLKKSKSVTIKLRNRHSGAYFFKINTENIKRNFNSIDD